MFTETKKIILYLSILFSSLMPMSYTTAAIGFPCGGNEEQYAQQLQESPQSTDPNELQQEREALRQEYKDNSCQLKDLFTGLAKVINYLVGFIGIFVVFRIVVAGFQMVISAGNADQLKSAKSALGNAVTGLIIVLLSYAIVNTIFSLFAVRLGLQDQFTFPYNPFQD